MEPLEPTLDPPLQSINSITLLRLKREDNRLLGPANQIMPVNLLLEIILTPILVINIQLVNNLILLPNIKNLYISKQ